MFEVDESTNKGGTNTSDKGGPTKKGKDAIKKGKSASGNTFDNILKAIAGIHKELFIPLINDVFGCDYPLDTHCELVANEHISVVGKTYNDVTIRIGDAIYHVECQSTTDGTMALRMLEYDLITAIMRATKHGLTYRADIPKSCVIYLRDTKNTPDWLLGLLVDPYNRQLPHFSKVVKALQYTLDDIFQKHLLLLFPFRLMRYNDNSIKKIAENKTLTEELVTQCESELTRLKNETFDKGKETLFRNLVSYTVQVIDHLFVKYDELRVKLRKAMGVRYIETALQAQERAEKERDDAEARAIAAEEKAIAAEEKAIAAEKRANAVMAERDAAVAELATMKEQTKSLEATIIDLTATLTKLTEDTIQIMDATAEKLGLKASDTIHSNALYPGKGPLPTVPAI